MKFGGSSVANAERIERMAAIVRERLAEKPALVLSAMGDTTDYLLDAGAAALREGPLSVGASLEKITAVHLEAARGLGLGPSLPDELSGLLADLGALLSGVSLIRELSPRSKDLLLSFGERLSARVVAAYLNRAGIKARALDAWDAGIVSDSAANVAGIKDESREAVARAVLPLVEAGVVPVITGFIARDGAGVVTTLGRGGSDLSATFIAAACGAREAQVWKDVDGVLTADPRVVPHARPVPEVSYEEAAELAYFGSQVLHPRSMAPCIKTGTPVLVKNSYNPAAPGTRIVAQAAKSAGPARAITVRRNVTLIDIVSSRMLGQSGFLAEVFAAFAKSGVSVDMVATSEVSVSLTLDSDYRLDEVERAVSRVAAVNIKRSKAIVTIICDISRSALILEKAAGVCARQGVALQMISQGASKVNISFIINDEEAEPTARLLHAAFFD